MSYICYIASEAYATRCTSGAYKVIAISCRFTLGCCGYTFHLSRENKITARPGAWIYILCLKLYLKHTFYTLIYAKPVFQSFRYYGLGNTRYQRMSEFVVSKFCQVNIK